MPPAAILNDLTDVDVLAVSIVTKGANRKRWFMRKGLEGSDTELLSSPAPTRLLIEKGERSWSTVYCVVAEPGWLEDAGLHGDQAMQDRWASADEIRKAAHKFAKNGGRITKLHESLEPYGVLVENAVAPCDLEITTPEGATEVIKAGSWYIGIEPTEDGWMAIDSGEFTGVSIEGTGVRTPVAKAASTKAVARDAAYLALDELHFGKGAKDGAGFIAKSALNVSPKSNWVEQVGGLPKVIADSALHQLEEGHAKTRQQAIATAVNWAKKMCSTGRAFGGKVKVSAKAQARACAGVAEWEAKKARAHVTKSRFTETEHTVAAVLNADSDTVGSVDDLSKATKTTGHIKRRIAANKPVHAPAEDSLPHHQTRLLVSAGYDYHGGKWHPPKPPHAAGAKRVAKAARTRRKSKNNLPATTTPVRGISKPPTRTAIKTVQHALKAKGTYTGKVDGWHGPKTSRAVRSTQKANNLPMHGKVVDAKTAKAIGAKTPHKIGTYNATHVDGRPKGPIAQHPGQGRQRSRSSSIPGNVTPTKPRKRRRNPLLAKLFGGDEPETDPVETELMKARATFGERMAARDIEDELPAAFDELRYAISSAFYPAPDDAGTDPGALIKRSLSEFDEWATDLLSRVGLAKIAEQLEKAGAQIDDSGNVAAMDTPEELEARFEEIEERLDTLPAEIAKAIKDGPGDEDDGDGDGDGDAGGDGDTDIKEAVANLAKSVGELKAQVTALGAGNGSDPADPTKLTKTGGDEPWEGIV